MTKKLLLSLALLLAVFGAVQALSYSGWLTKPEFFYQDLWCQMAGRRYHPRHVVIVSVGDAALAAHPDEPLVTWSPHWARALQVLRAPAHCSLLTDH